MQDNKYGIGIDLGTSNTCVAIYKKNNNIQIIKDKHDFNTIPSCLYFAENKTYVGREAIEMSATNSKNYIYAVKRLIGQKFSDEHFKQESNYFSYDCAPNFNDDVVIKLSINKEEHTYHPEQILSIILDELKKNIKLAIGFEVKELVITVPAYFKDNQRQAIIDSAKMSGIEVQRIINEPTAASLAYGLCNNKNKKILVYDLGGGTLDVTILELTNGIFKVISTNGNTKLGGEDFNNRLIDYCIIKFSNKHLLQSKLTTNEKEKLCCLLSINNLNLIYNLKLSYLENIDIKNDNIIQFIKEIKLVLLLKNNKELINKLRTKCEQAKIELTHFEETNIVLPLFYNDITLNIKIKKISFESLCATEFNSCMIPVNEVLKDSELTEKDIDNVILIGGSTKIPKIRNMLEERFTNKIEYSLDPDETVAKGACIYSAMINDIKDDFLDNILLMDIVPFSVGIEVENLKMKKIICKNSILPVSKNEIFTTTCDCQPNVKIKIYEGDNDLTSDNELLGYFNLNNLPLLKIGEPKINVLFSIDINNILTVTASVLEYSISNNITINRS